MLQDLTSFKLYNKVVISQHLDLTLLYADWTCQEINSLTHSHLVVLILFLKKAVQEGFDIVETISAQCVAVLVLRN